MTDKKLYLFLFAAFVLYSIGSVLIWTYRVSFCDAEGNDTLGLAITLIAISGYFVGALLCKK
jgi:hypothetical protein